MKDYTITRLKNFLELLRGIGAENPSNATYEAITGAFIGAFPEVVDSPPNILLQKTYDGNSLLDLEQDVWDAFDPHLNPEAGYVQTRPCVFRVTIEYENCSEEGGE